MGRRVMLADAFHLAALLFVHSRVVSDQIPCDNGYFGAPTTFWLHVLELKQLSLHHERHLRAKALLPPGHQRCAIPGGSREETTEAAETASLGHAALQS